MMQLNSSPARRPGRPVGQGMREDDASRWAPSFLDPRALGIVFALFGAWRALMKRLAMAALNASETADAALHWFETDAQRARTFRELFAEAKRARLRWLSDRDD